MSTENKFGKTICSIFYEDLKPIVEDLQQWFEYCASTKKCTCPVCKQGCSANNVSRLYFQSVGDQSDSVISQKVKDREAEDPEVLRGEVNRLWVKVSRLNSALEVKRRNFKKSMRREWTREEVSLKNEALRQERSIHSTAASFKISKSQVN